MPRLAFTVNAAKIGDDRRSWVQLMYPGEEMRNGPWFFTITEADLDVFAASIKEQAGKLLVDRDHRVAQPELADTRAAGWFTGDTEVIAAGQPRPDGSDERAATSELWAEVEWTPRAVQEIRDGEFRFMSPVFDFEDRDTKTGLLTRAKEIVNATLTNRPFFDRLAPVSAEVVWQSDEGYQRLSDLLYAHLNPGAPDDARYWVMDVAPAKALVREYDTQTTWVVAFTRDGDEITVADRSEWTAAEQEWVEAAQAAIQRNGATRPFTPTKESQMETKALAAALGLPEDATDEQIVEAATTAREGAVKAEGLETKVAELEQTAAGGDEQATKIAELETKLAAQESERAAEKIEAALTAAVTERRIVPAQKDVLAETFVGNLDGLQKVLAASPAGAVGRELGHGGDGSPDGDEAVRAEHGGGDEPLAGVDLHVAAVKILAEAGKTEKYTPDEYADALVKAERRLTVAA